MWFFVVVNYFFKYWCDFWNSFVLFNPKYSRPSLKSYDDLNQWNAYRGKTFKRGFVYSGFSASWTEQKWIVIWLTADKILFWNSKPSTKKLQDAFPFIFVEFLSKVWTSSSKSNTLVSFGKILRGCGGMRITDRAHLRFKVT